MKIYPFQLPHINPLLYRLFLDHDIISIFRHKKNQEKCTFENIMKNGAFAPKEQKLHFQ